MSGAVEVAQVMGRAISSFQCGRGAVEGESKLGVGDWVCGSVDAGLINCGVGGIGLCGFVIYVRYSMPVWGRFAWLVGFCSVESGVQDSGERWGNGVRAEFPVVRFILSSAGFAFVDVVFIGLLSHPPRQQLTWLPHRQVGPNWAEVALAPRWSGWWLNACGSTTVTVVDCCWPPPLTGGPTVAPVTAQVTRGHLMIGIQERGTVIGLAEVRGSVSPVRRFRIARVRSVNVETIQAIANVGSGKQSFSMVPIVHNEFPLSSVENLVPIPSESEDFSDNESECDETFLTFTTFSNPLFDSNDDFTSSDDESLSDEDVPMENFKIYSNHLFNDEEIISPKIDPHYFNVESNLIEYLLNRDILIDSSPKFDYLLEEFSGELAHIDPIPPGIEKADFDLEEEIRLVENLLYDNSSPRPPKEINLEITDTILESLSPSPILVEDSDSLM
ncbi:hypothetical protein Tco_0435412 [Tanacetum coccineum]